VQRDANARFISIAASYTERFEVPGYVRTFSFNPRAEGKY
jgi:hypothetical protein